jgi:hypothetical protein
MDEDIGEDGMKPSTSKCQSYRRNIRMAFCFARLHLLGAPPSFAPYSSLSAPDLTLVSHDFMCSISESKYEDAREIFVLPLDQAS